MINYRPIFWLIVGAIFVSSLSFFTIGQAKQNEFFGYIGHLLLNVSAGLVIIAVVSYLTSVKIMLNTIGGSYFNLGIKVFYHEWVTSRGDTEALFKELFSISKEVRCSG